MPKLTDERRARQRARLISAARLCFVRQGFQATTMAQIIRESGLSAGAVYGYFASKQELGIASMGEEMARLNAALAPVFSAPPAGGLREALQQILAAITAMSDGSETDFRRLAIVGIAEAQRDPAMMAAMLSHLEPLQSRLTTLICHYGPVRDPAAATDLVLSLTFGRLQSHVLFGRDLALPDLSFTELSL